MTVERFTDSPRWPFVADCLIAAGVLVLQLVSMYFLDKYRNFVSWHVLLEIAGCSSLLLRRRFPVLVLACVTAVADIHAWIRLYHPEIAITPNVCAILVGVYAVSTALRLMWAALVTLLVLVMCTMLPPPDEITSGVLQGVKTWIVMVVIAVTLGQVQRRSRRRARRLEQTLGLLDDAHQKLADEAVLVERSRIAREMHDIVAHGLSVIAVRAGVARALLPTDPGQVAEAVGVIEQTSRESLVEMRTMLGVLRTSDQDADGRPQPGLHRIPELIERARESGLDLKIVREGDPPALAPGQELVVYRLVQEALTNVLKHAGPVRTTVTFRCLPDRLMMDVFNEAPDGPAPETVRSGHGLVGMRERVGMYGGVVNAGPVDGGFRVTAELPVEKR